MIITQNGDTDKTDLIMCDAVYEKKHNFPDILNQDKRHSAR